MDGISVTSNPPTEKTYSLTLNKVTLKEKNILLELGNWHEQIACELFKMVGPRRFPFTQVEVSRLLLEFYKELQEVD